MYNTLKPVLQQELADIESAGLYKRERIITSPQGAEIEVELHPDRVYPLQLGEAPNVGTFIQMLRSS